MKRIVTIQDISCVGKCSLTVALPIISAMGVETAILPTAVLSTHTMFPSPTCADLTDEIEPISRHWVSQDLDFDAIYTGYLASGRQISLVSRFFQTFRREGTPVIVDPAMAGQWKALPRLLPGFSRTDEGALPAGGHPASQHHGGVFASPPVCPTGKNTTGPIRRKC